MLVCFPVALMSQSSSNGYTSCTGLSMNPVTVFSSTPRTIPSFPGNVLFTIANGHVPLFLLLVLTMTASPSFGWNLFTLWAELGHSLRGASNSLCHLLHSPSLQAFKNFARILSSDSLIHHASRLGN